MRLPEVKRGRRGPKANELVTTESDSAEFDLIRDVPPQRWQEAREAIERFVKEPEEYPAYGQVVCGLALLDPQLMETIQSSEEFRQAAESEVKKRWYRLLNGAIFNRLSFLVNIEPFLIPFPELRKIFSPYIGAWEGILGEVKDQDLNSVLDMNDPVDIYFSLIRLFPNRQGEIQEILQSDRVKRENFDLAEDSGRDPERRLPNLALLRLLYPEETDRIKSLGKEVKSKLPKEYFDDHVSQNGFLILSLAILFADEARLQSDGSIYIQTKKESLGTVPKLPDRLVA